MVPSCCILSLLLLSAGHAQAFSQNSSNPYRRQYSLFYNRRNNKNPSSNRNAKNKRGNSNEPQHLSEEDVSKDKSPQQIAKDLQSNNYFFSKNELSNPEFSLINEHSTFEKLCSSVGITRPSRIQSLAWPSLLSGKHAIIADQTGSGKTLSYLLPLLQRMKMLEHRSGNNSENPSAVQVLVLAPTAELCDQIKKVCAKLANSGVPFRTMVATANGRKAAPIRDQIRELQSSNVNVLVSTPGRVSAFLKSGSLDLSYLQAIVLDEVDILLDETFGPQLRTVGVAAPESTQFVFVTATLPDNIVQNVKSEFPGVLTIKGPGLHKIAPNVQEHLVDVSVPPAMNRDKAACFNLKSSELMRSLRKNKSERTLIFCNTVESCRSVENLLKRNDRRGKAYNVGCYHGALSPSKRNRDLAAFSKPTTDRMNDQVLICTDRAARGVDFGGSVVDHVIIFDFPKDPAEYLRRVGRTARAGRKGISTVFAYGWQLPIARSIMGKKLQSFSVAANNKLRGESDDNGDNKGDADFLISSKIQSGELWRENSKNNAGNYGYDEDEW